MPILMFVAWMAILSAWPTAFGQEIGHTHAGAVGHFYQTWLSPEDRKSTGERLKGCCNNVDCASIIATRRANRRDGILWEVQSGLEPGVWYLVPNWIWEDGQGDPRESPDGRGHVCIMGGRVICAVRASDG
jgi:hypothetical protein